MCSVPGVPTPGSKVSVVITRVNLNQNCGLVELWVNMNKDIRHVYEQMKEEIQLPQRSFCGSEGKTGDLCLVSVAEKWHRARIVAVQHEKYEIFLIDQAQPHSTTSAALAWCKDECFILPPEIESCVLANVLSIENDWPEQAVNFLKSLPGKEFEGLVQHALMPDRTILLHVPVISKHLCKKGVAKKIPVAEFKNLVLKCLNLPEEDATEPMSTEQSLNACNQLENADCYFYPELFTNTFESIRVTEVNDAADVFCQLLIFSKSIKILSEQINEEYKDKSAIEDSEPLTIGMPCAAKGVDGNWKRGVVKQLNAPTDPTVGVFFVDEGKHELVQATNVKKLDPKYLRMPVVTYHCILEGVRRDKEWTKAELDHLKSLLSNQNIVARFERHILPGDSYSVSLYTASAACINDYFMEKKDKEINEDAKQKFGHPLLNGASQEVASPSFFPKNVEQNLLTHASPFSPLETPLCDLLTVGSSVAVNISYIDSPSKFWCQTSQCDKKLDVLMKDLQAHYASVHPKPLVESICVARNPDDNLWYRAKIIANKVSPDVEVRFVDYGQTKKVPLAELRPIDPTFLRLDAQAFQCSLANIPPKDVNYAKEEFHKFVDSNSAQTSGLKCVIKAVASDDEGMLLNMVDLQTQSESACQVLAEKLSARPETFIQSSHNLEVNSKENICISYSETVHSFYCQLSRDLHLFRKVQDDIQRQMTNYVPSDCSFPPNSMCIARYTDSNWYRGQVLEASPDLKVYFVDLGQTLTLNKADIRPCAREASWIKTVPVLAIPMGLFNIPEAVPQEANEWFAQKVVGVTLTMSVIEKEQNGKFLVELVDGSKSLNAQVREKIVYVAVKNKRLCNGAKKTPMADMEVEASQPEQSQKFQNGGADMDDWILVEAESEVQNGTAEKESPEEKMETGSEQTNEMEIDNDNKMSQPKKITPPVIFSKKPTYKMPILSFNKTMELFPSDITAPDFFWCQCNNTGDLDKVNKLAQIEGQVTQDPFFPLLLIPGNPCLALYKKDNQWYRAQVIEKFERALSVVFIDYGTEVDVEYKDVRPLSTGLLEVAPQAFLCCLDELDEMKLRFGDRFSDKFYKTLRDKPLKVKVLSMGHNSEINVPQYNVQVEDVDLHKLLQKARLFINGDALYERPMCNKTVFYSFPNGLLHQTMKVYASSISSPGYFWCQYKDSTELDRITKIAQKSGWAEDPLYPESLVPGSPCLALYSEDNEWCRAQIIRREKDKFSVVFVDYGNEEDVPLINVRPIQPRLMEIKPQAFLCYMENFDENAETWDEALCDNFYELLLDKIIKIRILSVKHNEEVGVPQYTVQFDFDMVRFCKSYVSPKRPQTTTQNIHNVPQKTPAKAPEASLSTQKMDVDSQKTPVKTLTVDLNAFKFNYPQLTMNQWVKARASSISGPEYFWCQCCDTFYLDYVTKLAQTEGMDEYDSNFANSLVPGRVCLALFSDDNKWNRAQIRSKTADQFSVLFIDFGNEANVSVNDVRPMSKILLDVFPQAFLCCLEGFDLTKGTWDDEVYDAFNNLVDGHDMEVTPFRSVENEEIKLPQFVMKVVVNKMDVKFEMLKYWKANDKIEDISSGLAQSISISAPSNMNLSMQRGLKKPNVFLDRTEEVFATCIVDPHYFWCQFANSEELDKVARFTQDAGRTQDLPSSLDIGDLCVALFSDDSDPDSDNLWYRAVVREKNEKLKVAFFDYGNEAKINFKDTRLMPQYLVEQPPQAFFCTLHGFDKTKGSWDEKGCEDFFNSLVDKRLKVKVCSMEENQELALPQYSVQIECDGLDVSKLMEKYWKETADEAPKSSLLGKFFGF